MEKKKNNVFEVLNAINVNGHKETREQKGVTLSYLSWAWAWAEVKKVYPEATYTIYENADGWNYHTDGRTCWVKTGVTIEGLEYIEYLPVMNYANKSIPVNEVTSFDVNKAIQRSLTKAAARHGLGLYIYAGEDLPECDTETKPVEAKPKKNYPKAAIATNPVIDPKVLNEKIEELRKCVSRAELTAVWNANKALQGEKRYWDACEQRANELNNKTA